MCYVGWTGVDNRRKVKLAVYGSHPAATVR